MVGEYVGMDVYVIVCFGDLGLFVVCEIVCVLVLGIVEVVMYVVSMIVICFFIVIILDCIKIILCYLVCNYGMEYYCVWICVIGIEVLEFEMNMDVVFWLIFVEC